MAVWWQRRPGALRSICWAVSWECGGCLCADQRLCGLPGAEEIFRYSNYLVLWLQLVVTGLVTAGLFSLFAPGTVEPLAFFKALTPITGNTHWYFTAYTGLFFRMPLLNAGVRGSSREQLYKLADWLLQSKEK